MVTMVMCAKFNLSVNFSPLFSLPVQRLFSRMAKLEVERWLPNVPLILFPQNILLGRHSQWLELKLTQASWSGSWTTYSYTVSRKGSNKVSITKYQFHFWRFTMRCVTQTNDFYSWLVISFRIFVICWAMPKSIWTCGKTPSRGQWWRELPKWKQALEMRLCNCFIRLVLLHSLAYDVVDKSTPQMASTFRLIWAFVHERLLFRSLTGKC